MLLVSPYVEKSSSSHGVGSFASKGASIGATSAATASAGTKASMPPSPPSGPELTFEQATTTSGTSASDLTVSRAYPMSSPRDRSVTRASRDSSVAAARDGERRLEHRRAAQLVIEQRDFARLHFEIARRLVHHLLPRLAVGIDAAVEEEADDVLARRERHEVLQ